MVSARLRVEFMRWFGRGEFRWLASLESLSSCRGQTPFSSDVLESSRSMSRQWKTDFLASRWWVVCNWGERGEKLTKKSWEPSNLLVAEIMAVEMKVDLSNTWRYIFTAHYLDRIDWSKTCRNKRRAPSLQRPHKWHSILFLTISRAKHPRKIDNQDSIDILCSGLELTAIAIGIRERQWQKDEETQKLVDCSLDCVPLFDTWKS